MLLLTLRTAHLAGMSVQGKLSEYNLIVFYRLGGGSRREIADEPKVVLDEQERKQMIGGAFAQAMQT